MADSTEYFKPGVPLRPQRIDLKVAVRYRTAGEQSWHTGRTENISRSGVLIRGVRVLPLNAELEMILTLPAGILPDVSGELNCVGMVARVVPAVAGGSPGMGITFRSYRRA